MRVAGSPAPKATSYSPTTDSAAHFPYSTSAPSSLPASRGSEEVPVRAPSDRTPPRAIWRGSSPGRYGPNGSIGAVVTLYSVPPAGGPVKRQVPPPLTDRAAARSAPAPTP